MMGVDVLSGGVMLYLGYGKDLDKGWCLGLIVIVRVWSGDYGGFNLYLLAVMTVFVVWY